MAAETGGGDGGTWAVVVGLCSMVVNAAIAIICGVWALGRSSRETDDKIADKDKSVTDDLIGLERRLNFEIDQAQRNFGETVTAIRTKITETELWNRDNFVSKRTFQAVTDEFKRSLERFEDRLNDRLSRIDKKLDRYSPPDPAE